MFSGIDLLMIIHDICIFINLGILCLALLISIQGAFEK